MRYNNLIWNVMEGKINYKRERGRPKDTITGNLKKKLALANYESVKRLTSKRENWL